MKPRFKERNKISELEMQGILSKLRITRSIPNSTNRHELFTLYDCLNDLGVPVERIEMPCPPRSSKATS